MIDERTLRQYEEMVEDSRYSGETFRPIVDKLVEEVRTLNTSRNRKTEKINELIAMVDYLTEVLASKHKCPLNIECPQKSSDYIVQSECARCWRNEAKKVVKSNE